MTALYERTAMAAVACGIFLADNAAGARKERGKVNGIKQTIPVLTTGIRKHYSGGQQAAEQLSINIHAG